MLHLEGEETVTDVEYIDPTLPSGDPLGRDFIVDVLCQTQKQERFLLEMQNNCMEGYYDKSFIEFVVLLVIGIQQDSNTLYQALKEKRHAQVVFIQQQEIFGSTLDVLLS